MRPIEFKLEASQFEYKGYKFLITDMPSDCSIKQYVNQLQKYEATHVIRVCKPTYNIEELLKRGIEVYDLVYDDGSSPSKELVQQWLHLIRKHHKETPDKCVAVHCVAGLGRAPVMVAISLMELGMDYEDAVEIIRKKRRGAINAKQLNYLAKYRPRALLRNKQIFCSVL